MPHPCRGELEQLAITLAVVAHQSNQLNGRPRPCGSTGDGRCGHATRGSASQVTADDDHLVQGTAGGSGAPGPSPTGDWPVGDALRGPPYG